jgi:glutathione S-transferase
VRATLYSLALSHPAMAARRMLEIKGIPTRVLTIPPGLNAPVVRAARFPGPTVPALKLDGRKVQGSLAISRVLDELVPEPPLFPRDPASRAAVEEAERFGEAELQPLPRRFFRWSTVNDFDFRAWLAASARMPAPRLQARMSLPIARWYQRQADAYDAEIRSDLERLPALLDRVDSLIAEGTIGSEEPNAADIQIGSSVRALGALPQLAPLIEGRPAGDMAGRLFPRYPRVPPALPAEWIPSAAARATFG